MGRTMVIVDCATCGREFERDQYEVKRNKKLGRANCCSRHCQAIYMDKSPARRAYMSRKSRTKQWGKNNPNWKGGIAPKRRTKQNRRKTILPEDRAGRKLRGDKSGALPVPLGEETIPG